MAYKSKWIDRRTEILAIAERVKADSPASWNELKVPGQESRRFINLVSLALLAAGIPAGVNLKRGGPQQSIDVIALPNDTGCPDSTGTYPGLELIDLVGGAEGPSPVLIWNDVTDDTIAAGTRGGWQAGSLVVTPEPHPVPPKPTLPGREEMMQAGQWLEGYYKSADGLGRPLYKPGEELVDWEGVGAWLFDVYLQARIAGQSIEQARAAVVSAIQQTDEWKGKHR